MPLYEYRCESCSERVEVLQKFSDEPLKVCSKCGGSLEKLISPAGLHFKGSGFYITDYGRSGKGSNGGKAEKADKAAEKAERTESKSEAKSEKSSSETKTEKPAASSTKSDKT